MVYNWCMMSVRLNVQSTVYSTVRSLRQDAEMLSVVVKTSNSVSAPIPHLIIQYLDDNGNCRIVW